MNAAFKPVQQSAASGEASWLRILGPARWLMDRLVYVNKFVLIGALFLVPLVAVTVLQSTAATEKKTFNEKEVRGIEYLTPTRDFLNAVHRHRLLSMAVLSGDASFATELSRCAAEVDSAVTEVDAVDLRNGSELKAHERWAALRSQWNATKAARGSVDDADKAHADLDASILDFVVNVVANNSNLILDPDLDSYWLMDALTVKLPVIESNIASAAALTLRPGADAATQLDRRLDGAGFHRVLVNTVSDLDAIDFATTFKEVANFSKSSSVVSLKDDAGRMRSSADKFADRYRQGYVVPAVVPTPDARRALVNDALDVLKQARTLAAKTTPELSGMCQKRADAATRVRFAGVTLAVVATMFLFYLFAGFFRSVKGSVDALRSATGRMIAGTDEVFSLTARDELGAIASSYNDINRVLGQARVLGAKMEQDNRTLESDVMELLQVVADASDGKLYVRAKVSEGTVGTVSDAFNQLMESISAILGKVTAQLNETNRGVGSIVGSAESVLRGAETQTAEVRSATGAVKQIVDQTERVASTAQAAANAADRAEKSAADGGESVATIATAMGTLRASVQTGAKKVKSLGDRSMEITGIVGTINRIAEQTNMLALNAAIEAARAGENGRGFSVVAEEIRKLAERAAAATQEIDKLVRAIQVETQETVSAIEQQTSLVEQQGELVSRAGDALLRIREVSGQTTGLVAQILEGTRLQVDGTGLITKTVGRIASVTDAAESDARSTVTVAGDLRGLSELLAKSMSQFKLSRS
jgi:twitching motility protein PilJ